MEENFWANVLAFLRLLVSSTIGLLLIISQTIFKELKNTPLKIAIIITILISIFLILQQMLDIAPY